MFNYFTFYSLDLLGFFDALTAHAVVPIIPAWLIYAYAVPIEFAMVCGLNKILNALKVRWSR